MKKYKRVTDKQKADIKRLWEGGLKCHQIATKMGLRESLVRYHIKEKVSVRMKDKVRVTKICRLCGHFNGFKYRNLTAKEKQMQKIEKAQRLLARAKELGLI